MKFLLLLGLFLAVVWLARGGRRSLPRDGARTRAPDTPQASASTTEEMVACAHCGVHLPKGEAVVGPAGRFCSVEHRDVRSGARPS